MASVNSDPEQGKRADDEDDKEEVETSSASPRASWQAEEFARVQSNRSYAAELRPRRASLARSHSYALSVLRSRGSGNAQARQRFTHKLDHTPTTSDVLVNFEGPDDPYAPLNWPSRKKAMTTMLYGLTTAGITFASAVYSVGTKQIEREFNIGSEVSALGLSLLLLGFGIGPLLWAPLSEVYGRKSVVLLPYFVSAIFSFATGAAKDIQTIMISRFFTGFFGSAPITNTGGVLGDVYSAEQRAIAMVGYASAVVGGPLGAPLIGGAIISSGASWRWTEYLTGMLMMVFLTLDILLIDESYPSVLLVRKARRLRIESGNWALHAKHEEWDVSLWDLCRKYLVRPFQLLMTPICFLMALYASFCYGILYSNLSAFPIVFQELRGWGPVTGGLPFIAMLVGIAFAGAINIANQKYYKRCFAANGNRPAPEARLPPMMVGSVFFAGGLFLFAWTADPKFHWIAPVIGCAMLGTGFFTIFQSALNYLVDTFQKYAASAVAANTCLRSLFAAAFPLFITQELNALGVDWGISVFAFFATALLPIPYLFFIFGKRIRARGAWSKDSVGDLY